MWKLQRLPDPDCKVLTLSGRIQGDHLAELVKALADEIDGKPLVLDLGGVKLVDQQVVTFLASCQRSGTRLRNCPAYIREWIEREEASPRAVRD
jgi:anti-anti-sigma regulatory factor